MVYKGWNRSKKKAKQTTLLRLNAKRSQPLTPAQAYTVVVVVVKAVEAGDRDCFPINHLLQSLLTIKLVQVVVYIELGDYVGLGEERVEKSKSWRWDSSRVAIEAKKKAKKTKLTI